MGFTIIRSSGFHIEFVNGYSVSVQFGPGNYCEHYHGDILDHVLNPPAKHTSMDAEVAVIYNNELLDHPDFGGDTVKGYCEPEYVLKLMNWASSQTAAPKREADERIMR